MFLILSLPAMARPFVSNVANLCLARFALRQTGVCGWEGSSLTAALLGDAVCGSFQGGATGWTAQNEIVLNADELQYREGKLRELTPEQIASGDYSFEKYIVLTSNYGTSIALDIPVGVYQLELHGKHDRPGPVYLNVYAGRKPIGTLEFARDDDSWESKCLFLLPMHWPEDDEEKPQLEIRMRFVNDGGEQGSRDAYVAWLRFTPLPLGTAE